MARRRLYFEMHDSGCHANGVNTVVFDGESRSVSSSGSLGSGTYTYDGNGLRVKKVSGSTTTVYIFSGSKVIAEYDNGATPSAPSREYIYAGGALLARIDASGTRYYQHDHLSNRLITDSSGNILAQLGHSPFGESWYNASNEKWLFTTYERDAESGNDYAMARSYASRLGRFLSPDPAAGGISDPQSLNRYSYAHNDPINLVDPSGMFVAPQIYALMRFYNVPMFGSLWNEFDLLEFAFTPSGEVPVVRNGDPGFMDVYGNLGALDFLTGGGIRVKIPPPPPPPGYAECMAALAAIHQTFAAVERALSKYDTISMAAAVNGLDPELLAAIGVRESGFVPKKEKDGAGVGVGVGVYQLTVKPGSGVAAWQANDITKASFIAAEMLNENRATLARSFPQFTIPQLMQATAASFNFGVGNISGNPATIDVGSTGNNYGANVLGLMNCFH